VPDPRAQGNLSPAAARPAPAGHVPPRADVLRRVVQQCSSSTTLKGRTPNEAYYRRFPNNRRPRYEPRTRWPRASPCAGEWALIRGQPGVKLELHVEFIGGHKHLPFRTLCRAA